MSFWTSLKEKFSKKKTKPLPPNVEKILKMPPPNLDMPIKAVRYVVFDTETTGLKKEAELVAIGAIGIKEGRVVLSDIFYELIQPKNEIPADSIFIHGITPSMVEDRPKVDEVLLKFLEFCRQDILVGCHTGFDLMFINREMKAFFGIHLPNLALDILRLFRFLKRHSYNIEPEREAISLDTMAKELGTPVFDRHNVIGDVLGTAIIFQKLLGEMENMKLKDLIRIAKV
ncbi:MAG: 3'-5' exonuclease [Candidatus Desulfofervidus auxilii]|nr:3'-5' exonuclease [Candidatus Desulfofervidus auxilii]